MQLSRKSFIYKTVYGDKLVTDTNVCKLSSLFCLKILIKLVFTFAFIVINILLLLGALAECAFNQCKPKLAIIDIQDPYSNLIFYYNILKYIDTCSYELVPITWVPTVGGVCVTPKVILVMISTFLGVISICEVLLAVQPVHEYYIEPTFYNTGLLTAFCTCVYILIWNVRRRKESTQTNEVRNSAIILVRAYIAGKLNGVCNKVIFID